MVCILIAYVARTNPTELSNSLDKLNRQISEQCYVSFHQSWDQSERHIFFYPFSLIWLSFFFLFPKLNIELNNIRRGKDTIEQKACWEWFLDLNRENTEKFNIYAIFFLQSFLLLLTNSLRLNEYVKWVLSPWRKKEEKQLRKKLHLKQTKISDSVFSGVSLSCSDLSWMPGRTCSPCSYSLMTVEETGEEKIPSQSDLGACHCQTSVCFMWTLLLDFFLRSSSSEKPSGNF